MAGKAQSIRVGLFAIATLALAAVVLIVFGGVKLWDKSDRYTIVFPGSVMGLEPGAVVFMNGIKVGTVDALKVGDDISRVAVAIKLKQGTPIHEDTRAMLQYAGITGLKVIDLRDGTAASAKLPPGSQIEPGVGLLDKFEQQAKTIADQSTELIKRANQLTDNLIALTEPAGMAAKNFAEMSGSLKAMVDENRVALRRSIAAIQTTANGATELLDTRVAQLFGDAGDVVAEVKKLVTSNEGPLRAAVFDFRQASRTFKELVRDVRQKPSRLLFSSSPAERKLP